MYYSTLTTSLIFAALLTLTTGLVRLSVKWRRVRSHYRSLPGPPHSFWLGHLKIFGDAMKELPPRSHPHIACAMLAERYKLGDVFYLDLWPAAEPFLVVQDPAFAAQVTQINNLPKHELEKTFLRNMTGERSLVSAEGPEWRALRSMLNPGFAAAHLTSMVPKIVKHLVVFRDKLETVANTGQVVQLQELAALATIDVVGEAAIGVSLNSQSSHSDIADYFRKAIAITGPSMDPIGRLKTLIPHWWYCRNLDKALAREILNRYQTPGFDDWGQRAIPDLVLQASKAGKLDSTVHKGIPSDYRDPRFMQLAVNNIKTLLLGGHDTSATALSYTVYLLSTNTQCLSTLRKEHESFFGKDPSVAIQQITTQPHLLNQLNYTTACIREALRLFPPGATVRTSTSQTTQHITYNGRDLPLSGNGIWITHFGMGRRSDLWPDPTAFKPERFMPGYTPEPPRDAFRPFEKGPRACIGVELAYIELKIMLVLVARSFDFEATYPDNAPKAPEKWGGVVYQIMELAPKPAGHMPVRVNRRKAGV